MNADYQTNSVTKPNRVTKSGSVTIGAVWLHIDTTWCGVAIAHGDEELLEQITG